MDIESGNLKLQAAESRGCSKGVHISFHNVTYVVRKRDGTDLTVLNNVSGRSKPGRVLAIMGQSGSGKTSLVRMAGPL